MLKLVHIQYSITGNVGFDLGCILPQFAWLNVWHYSLRLRSVPSARMHNDGCHQKIISERTLLKHMLMHYHAAPN